MTAKTDTTSREYRRLVEQEDLIADASELIYELMEARGVSQVELSKRVGKTKGHVSQVLSGSRNMTLRTLADMTFALDCRVVLHVESEERPRSYRKAFNPQPTRATAWQAVVTQMAPATEYEAKATPMAPCERRVRAYTKKAQGSQVWCSTGGGS